MHTFNHSPSLSPEAITQHFETTWKQYMVENPALADCMELYLQFLTIVFDISHLDLPVFPGSATSPAILLQEFGKIYFRLVKHMLGNHLYRKRKQQPLTYAFVDFEGTRSSKPMQDVLKCKFPHVHAVMLVPPKCMTPVLSEGSPIPHSKSFYWAIRNPSVFCLPSIRDPHRDFQVEQFDPAKSTLENLISYCMKGYLQVPQSYVGREDLWAVFPR
jgi:hypothetical protein